MTEEKMREALETAQQIIEWDTMQGGPARVPIELAACVARALSMVAALIPLPAPDAGWRDRLEEALIESRMEATRLVVALREMQRRDMRDHKASLPAWYRKKIAAALSPLPALP